jgi:hypothetical protein
MYGTWMDIFQSCFTRAVVSLSPAWILLVETVVVVFIYGRSLPLTHLEEMTALNLSRCSGSWTRAQTASFPQEPDPISVDFYYLGSRRYWWLNCPAIRSIAALALLLKRPSHHIHIILLIGSYRMNCALRVWPLMVLIFFTPEFLGYFKIYLRLLRWKSFLIPVDFPLSR